MADPALPSRALVVHCVTLLVRHDTANTLVIVRMYFSRPVGRSLANFVRLVEWCDLSSFHILQSVFTTSTDWALLLVAAARFRTALQCYQAVVTKFGGQAASTLVTICPFKLSSIVLCTGHDICRRGPLTRFAHDHLIACMPVLTRGSFNLCMFSLFILL